VKVMKCRERKEEQAIRANIYTDGDSEQRQRATQQAWRCTLAKKAMNIAQVLYCKLGSTGSWRCSRSTPPSLSADCKLPAAYGALIPAVCCHRRLVIPAKPAFCVLRLSKKSEVTAAWECFSTGMQINTSHGRPGCPGTAPTQVPSTDMAVNIAAQDKKLE